MLKVIKNNKTILLMPIIYLLLAIIGIGCTSKSEGHTEKRFVKIDNGYNCVIVYDTKTKVQYAIGNSITVLVDKDGKPLLYEGGNY